MIWIKVIVKSSINILCSSLQSLIDPLIGDGSGSSSDRRSFFGFGRGNGGGGGGGSDPRS